MLAISRMTQALGVRVITADLGDLHGAYLHDHRAALIDIKLGPIQRRSTTMHELGHAFFGHADSSARSEREASEWAANSLIRMCEFLDLSRVYETPQEMASPLGVLPRDVVNYQQWLERHCRMVAGR